MTASVHLVRHAAHGDLGQRLTGRLPHVELAPVGLRQAAAVARRLAREDVAAVHSSPLERARTTATAIAAQAGVGVELSEALTEIDFGEWSGKAFAELDGDSMWRRWNEQRSEACPPGGETMSAAQSRAVAYVGRAAAMHSGRNIVIVSHCDIIRALVAHYLGLALDNVLRFDIDPASVSTLLVGSWGARVVSLNEKVAE